MPMRDINLKDIPEKWYLEYHGTNLGVPIAHSPVEIFIVEHILYQLAIVKVIEIGVWFGGMTNLLIPAVEGNFLGIDIGDFRYSISKKMFSCYDNAKFLVGEYNNPKIVEEVHLFITPFIGKTLLYLDNGNKYEETLLYLPLLKRDDIAIVHDYGIEWNIDDKIMDIMKQFNISTPYTEKLRELGSKQMIFVKE